MDLCWIFFFIFLPLELVGSCGGGEAEHGGAGLEAEVLGGEFGSRTPLCSMEQQHGASFAVEKKMVSMGIELGAFFSFLLSLFIFYFVLFFLYFDAVEPTQRSACIVLV